MGPGEVGEFTYRVRKAWPCLGSAAVGGPLLSSSNWLRKYIVWPCGDSISANQAFSQSIRVIFGQKT